MEYPYCPRPTASMRRPRRSVHAQRHVVLNLPAIKGPRATAFASSEKECRKAREFWRSSRAVVGHLIHEMNQSGRYNRILNAGRSKKPG